MRFIMKPVITGPISTVSSTEVSARLSRHESTNSLTSTTTA